MTIEQRARSIAQKLLTCEIPYKAYATGDAVARQQERVLQEATRLVLDELRAFADELHVKL